MSDWRAVLLVGLLSCCCALGWSAAQPVVLNARLDLHWSADAEQAWYRRELVGGGGEYMQVLPAAGIRRVAFDHAKMADALQGALGRNIDATHLPIDDLRWSEAGRILQLRCGARWLAGPAATLALLPVTGLPPDGLERVPRASCTGGGASRLTLVNHSAQKLSISWCDVTGKRQSYGDVAAGELRSLNTYAGHVWVLTGDQGEIVGVAEAQAGGSRVEVDAALVARSTTPDAGEDLPQRSADGRYEAFIRDHNVWVKPLAGGEPFTLTTDGSPADSYDGPFAWSPDSSHLAARRIAAGEHRTVTLIESSPKDQVQPKSRSIRYDKPGDQLDQPRPCLFTLAERKQVAVAQDLLTNPWSIDDVQWRADSSGFTLLYNQRGHQLMRVVEVDRHGQTRSVIEERAATFIDYTNKVYYERCDGRGDVLWMSERDGWNHLYRFDAVSGSLKNRITTGQWVVRSVERVDAEAGVLWFTAGGVNPGEDPYHVHHGRVAFDGTGLTWLTAGDGTHTVVWSPGRRWLIDTWSRVDAAPQHVLRDGATGRQVVALEQADASALVAGGWRAPERFVAKGR
ncbi:MAG TPA: DPP IV N-terminal domain-containing protein, partial [Planctomycetota bacterium]|nr:DPP IV N-terminal domain-containing protein [Planctomycetota bacterium]